MRFNQFSYLSLPRNTILYEFKKYGFDFPSEMADKKMLEAFLSRVFFTYQDINYPLSILAVDKETDFLTFCHAEREFTADILYNVAFQLLGFS